MTLFGMRRHFSRRLVTWKRQVVGIVGLLILLSLIGGYQVLTRPERIRCFGEFYLESMTGGQVRIEAARFDLFEGLHLTGVAVAAHPSTMQPESVTRYEDRILFTARDLYLRLQPFSLITGNLTVPEIIATEPQLRLLRDRESDARNWHYLLRQRKAKKEGRAPSRNPTIRLRGARVNLAWTPDPARQQAGDFSLDVTATCQDDNPSVYDVRWRTRTSPVEEGRFAFDLGSMEMHTAHGGLPTIPVASVRWAAPAGLDDWLDLLDLRGQIRTDTLSYKPEHGGRAELAIEKASIAALFGEEDRRIPRKDRYLTFNDVNGKISFEGASINLALSGNWQGGTCEINGRIHGEMGKIQSLDDVGYELNVQARNIPLPHAPDRQSPAEARFVNRWHKLADFCRIFSPDGPADIDFAIAKKPQSQSPIKFLGGTLVARGVDAAYSSFPYRVRGLTGTVRFDPKGPIHIENLRGRHGPATIIVNGEQSQARWACGLDLRIEGQNVPLDEDLRSCLSPRYRRIWSLFDPHGSTNVKVHLQRPDSTTNEPAPTRTEIDASLLGVSARYTDVPLPMTDICGRIEISEDLFHVHALSGLYRGAPWLMQGTVSVGESTRPDVHLYVQGHGMPIDEALARDLPEAGRAMLQKITALGLVDLSGFIYSGDSDLDYDLNMMPALTELCIHTAPLPVINAQADLQIRPGTMSIRRLTAQHGEGRLTLQSDIRTGTNQAPIWTKLHADTMPLTPELFGVLPGAVQNLWQQIRPTGTVNADATITMTSDAGSDSPKVNLEIRPEKLAIQPAAMPLPLHDIRGVFQTDGRNVLIRDATAGLGNGTLTMNGSVTLQEDAWNAQAAVHATGVEFSDSLRRSMPWRMQRVWNGLQPQGRFDLILRNAAIRKEASGNFTWDVNGRLTLHDTNLAGAGTVRNMEGTLDARMTGGPDPAAYSIDGSLSLTRLDFGSYRIKDYSTRLTKRLDDSILHADELRATICGGNATGFAEFDLSPGRNTFAMSLVVQDLSLQQFVQTTQPAPGKPPTASGLLSGKLFLNGTLGELASRRGGGTVHLEEAQVMKMPIFLAMISMANFAPMDENAFHEGSAEFSLQGETLTLQPIELRGNSISFVGGGQVITSTQALDITLLAGSPHRLPNLGILSDLAEAAARELMELRVRGTLQQPRIEAQPLRSLNRASELFKKWREHQKKKN